MRVKVFFKFSLLLFALLQISCGMREIVDLGEFEPYVKQFEAASVKYGKPIQIISLTIKFGTLPNQTLAVCRLTQTEALILVNQGRWNQLTHTNKTLVMNHELGHCILNKKHDDSSDPLKMRKIKSIMNSHPLLATDYKVQEESYLAELFSEKSDN